MVKLIKEDEIFIDLPNSNYKISNYGRVYSKPFKRWCKPNKSYSNIKGKFKISNNNNSKKYWRTQLVYKINNISFMKHESIHRLVAILFLENPENKPFINHLDGNKNNNHVSNLEWCTNQENMNHRYKILKSFNNLHGSKNSNSKLTEKQAIDIATRLLNKEHPKSIHLDYNFISQSTINEIKSGRIWRHLNILPTSKIKKEKYYGLRYEPATNES